MTKKTEDKKRKEETREDKIERERTELLAKLTHSSLSDIRSRVGFILNHYPGTRNDDVALSIQYWKIFNTDLLSGNVVNLGDLYRLTRINSIIRARAKIQNTFGLFMADEETRKKRAQLDEEQRQIQVEDMPDIPLISIYCDESGKNDDNLIIGSVWINDGYRVLDIYKKLSEWRDENNVDYEFHFSALNRNRKKKTLEFVEKALSESDALCFKATIVDRKKDVTLKTDEAVYRLHYQLAAQGL